MMIPVPDFSDDSDFDNLPETATCPICNSSTLPKVTESISQPDLFTLSNCCDPDKTFMSTTSTGIEYDLENPIYHTKSCTLYIGRHQGKYYALKTSPSSNILMHEWDVYQKVGKCPTIIEAIDFITESSTTSNSRNSFPRTTISSSKYFLLLDYAFWGSIANSYKFFDSTRAWGVLAHITLALNFIHKHGYIHLDVSPSNILICKNNYVYDIFSNSNYGENVIYKLTDFGTVIKDGSFNLFCEGAGPYVSPEALYFPNSPYPVSYQTDIWSLGAVMFEIVTHSKMPRDTERYDAIRKGKIDLSLIVPDEFDVVRHMLNVDPSARPTTDQILDLPPVKEIISELHAQIEMAHPNGGLEPQMQNDETSDLLMPTSRRSIRSKRLSDDGLMARRQSFDGI